MTNIKDTLLPSKILDKRTLSIMVGFQVFLFLLFWTFSPSPILPTPLEVTHSLADLWQQGLAAEIYTSFILNLQSIGISLVICLALAYLTVIPFFRTVVSALSKLRFLSLAGLSFLFTIMTSSGHELKLSLMVFSVSVFFVTGMADVVRDGMKSDLCDLARTLRFSEWRVVWEVIVLGQTDKMFDVVRQNAAIGWMMLTMVEGFVKSEGGVGTVLADQNHHFHLAAVFGIQLSMLLLGLAQDYGIGAMKKYICAWS